MTITVTAMERAGKMPTAPLFVDEIDILCDNAYPANGWVIGLVAKLPKGATILSVQVDDIEKTGYQFVYDRTNDKLLVFECAAAGNPMAQLATATALNGKHLRLVATSY